MINIRAKDVLEVLQITRKTLYNYVKTKKIKIDSSINGQYRYNAESVFSLLNMDVPEKYRKP